MRTARRNRQNSTTSNYSSSTHDRGRSPRSGAKTARQFLYWLAIGVAVIVAVANMTPYIKAANFVLLEVFALQGLWAFFGNKALGFISLIVGAVLWGFIQTAETYPILLKHDRKLMRLIALEADESEQLPIRDNDDPALVRLKQWYNRFPLLSIRSANRLSLFAYGVDLGICLSIFPPVDGGIGQLVFVIFTGQWGLINWGSVALIITMLFCFEAMIRLILFLGMQAYWLRKAHS